MLSPDWKESAENVKDYISDNSFLMCRNVDEICGFLDAKHLKAIEFDTLFKNISQKYDRNSILDLLKHVNVEYTNNISEILNNLNMLFNLLNIPFILKMTESIGSIINNTITNSILNEIRSLKASQSAILEEMKSTTEAISKNVKLQIRHKNFNVMKKIPKNSKNFDNIYSLFEKIADENDYISMKLAIESNYNEVTATKIDNYISGNLNRNNLQIRASSSKDKYCTCTMNIITYGAIKNNFKLVKMLAEFGVNPSINRPCGVNALWFFCRQDNLEALKYFCGLLRMNANSPTNDYRSLLFIASALGYYDICEYLLSLDGVEINLMSNSGKTALSVAKSERIRDLLIKNGAKSMED